MDELTTEAPGEPPHPGMVWVPGGTFTMGSEKHYPEEKPSGPVSVEGFWMDETAVTNRQFAEFVEATGYVTTAEKAPDPAMYPGADPAMLVPGSITFAKPNAPVPGCPVAPPLGAGQQPGRQGGPPGHPGHLRGRRRLRPLGQEGTADRSAVGASWTGRHRGGRVRLG